MVGVIVLLVTKTFWPGILVLLGLTHYVNQHARGRSNRALGQLLFFGGLAFLFWAHMFWPAILLLIFGLHLLSSRRHGWRP